MTILIWCVCFTVISCDGHGPNSWQASASMWRWVISNEGELLPFQEDALIAGFWLNTMTVIGSVPMSCLRKHRASCGWALGWMRKSLHKQQPPSNQILNPHQREKKRTCSKWSRMLHRLTKTLWCDAAAFWRVDSPVVVLQRMHELKHSPHPTNSVVDGRCANKLSRKVGTQRELYLEHKHRHS